MAKHIDRVAMVTGGGSGIGRAVSVALAAAGFTVVIAGRRPGPLRATVREIESRGGRVLAVPADVADRESVTKLFARTRRSLGRLDLLFNNAGITGPTLPMEEVPYADWRAVVDTNLSGTFFCTQEAIGMMK